MASGNGNGDLAPRSSTGLSSEVAGGLSYVLGIITGVLFYALEKDDKFVRFHAMQSILLSVAWIVIWVALSIVEAILSVIHLGFLAVILSLIASIVLGLGGFVLWLVLIVKAFQGQKLHLPYIGDIAERNA